MARNVNIWTTNWHATGNNPPVPQYSVDMRLEWIGDDNLPREHEETLLFPNCLQDVPVSWLKEELTALMLRAARLELGID